MARRKLPPRMHQKHGAYYYVAQNKWTRLSDDYGEAIAKWSEMENAPTKARSVSAMLDAYLLDCGGRLATKTMEEYARQATKLKQVFKRFMATEVKPYHIAEYLAESKHKTAANREIALLSAAFSHVLVQWRLDSNPCAGIRRNKEAKRDQYISDGEMQALVDAASQQMRSMILLSYLTGMRKGDLLAIKLQDITDGGISLRQGKTGKRQMIEMTDALREVVDAAKALKRRVGTVYLFATRKGQPYTIDGFNSIWHRLKNKVGLGHIRWHDIRAKALTDADSQHGRDFAMKLAGHASVTTTERYLRGRRTDKVRPLK